MRTLSVLSCVVLFSLTGCYKYIDSGNVGVVVNLNGTNKGIDPKPRGVGRAFYNPITETVHEFPIYEQNVVWQRGGEKGDESFTISSAQSAQISVDVGMTFVLHEDKVPHLFGALRKDIDYIAHQWMRNHVREALSKEAEQMETMSILGEGKSELLGRAKSSLNKDLAPYGIEVKLLSFVNTPRPEEKILDSINLMIATQQLAKQAENKIAQSKAEANQSVETAKGRAEAVRLESEAKLVAAENEAKANQAVAKSITPELTRYEAIKKWDGKLPKFTGDTIPLISIGDVESK